MRFTPKSEAELSSDALWPVAEYDFEVSSAEEAQSKAGNDMVKLTLYVFNDKGDKRTVFDYLVSSEKAIFKVRQFAASVGLLAEYEAGELNAYDMQGRTGRLRLGWKEDPGYQAQNTVSFYLPAKDTIANPEMRRQSMRKQERVAAPADLDDEIPF